MTINTSKKYRLRGEPKSEVRGLWRDEEDETGTLYGWYRCRPSDDWESACWDADGTWICRGADNHFDLIPAPDAVKTKGFWLAVDAHGWVVIMDEGQRDAAERWADIGKYADLDLPQGAIEYFPPREYEAGSIIDPREEG